MISFTLAISIGKHKQSMRSHTYFPTLETKYVA